MSAPEPLDQGLNNGLAGGSATPGPSQPTPSDEWQRRHAGLQRSLEGMLTTTGWGKLEAIPKKGDVEGWQQAARDLSALQQQFEGLAVEKQTLTAQTAQLTTEKSAAELRARKAELLAEKAPDLFAFLRYIPTMAEETEQLAEFDKFRQTLGKTAPAEPRPAVPQQPTSQPAANTGVLASPNLMPAMIEALNKGDMATYNKLKDQWYAGALQPA